MRNIYIFAPLPAINKRTRISKMVRHFLSRGLKIQFYGWERLGNEANNLAYGHDLVEEKLILHGGGYSSSRARLMYPLWMIACFIRTLMIGRKKIIFCLGWESAFPAIIASKITGSKVIFDDADRFSLIFSLPRIVSKILINLERWTSRKSLTHIIPSFSRYEWRTPNMLVLRNTPLRRDFEAAINSTNKSENDPFTIYANGWLGETRGAPIFLKLLNNLQKSNTNVKMILAGRVDSPNGHLLANHPMSTYHGEIEQRKALEFYQKSDIVLTYYDPAIPINRKAESNKWGDCVFFHTPFIVNSEVETAIPFLESGAAFSVPYDDAEKLTELISALIIDRSLIHNAAENLERFRLDYPIFDDQLDLIINLIPKENQL